MRSFFISLQSEYYKSRKTLAFWAAIILPLAICGAIAIAYYFTDEVLKSNPAPMSLWMQYIGIALNVMGMLIMPFYVIFMAFSINNIEHRNDTWKTLFAQPLNKLAIYSAKYIYGVVVVFLCLFLFAGFTFVFAHLLELVRPAYKFNGFDPSLLLAKVYFKLFLSTLGILSIQFLFSLIWADFLKPMGIGFIATIMGIIMAGIGWKYAYINPYSHPALALQLTRGKKGSITDFPIFTHDIWVGIIVAIAMFIIGYFIVSRKTIK
jgi:hypothetical protein